MATFRLQKATVGCFLVDGIRQAWTQAFDVTWGHYFDPSLSFKLPLNLLYP